MNKGYLVLLFNIWHLNLVYVPNLDMQNTVSKYRRLAYQREGRSGGLTLFTVSYLMSYLIMF